MRELLKKMLLIVILNFLSVPFSVCVAQVDWALGYQIRESNLPALHSYAAAQAGDTLLLIGGRKDGLHLRQPSFAFDSLSRNDSIWVYDYNRDQVLGLDLSNLPSDLAAQLSSTNPQYAQLGDYLYIVGGYGYDPHIQDHRTFDRLIGLHIRKTIDYVYDQKPLDTSCYFYISDSLFAITGGVMFPFDEHLILACGHRFDGVYNPVDNPTFVQKYHTKIIEFQVNNETQSFTTIRLTDDPMLRRRDLSARVTRSSSQDKLTLYAGVFRPDVNFPYQFLIEYQNGQIKKVSDLRQSLSTYHTAHLSLDSEDLPSPELEGEIFIGGLAPYYFEDSILHYDTDIPFTSHISMLLRNKEGKYTEYLHRTSLPAYLGTATQTFKHVEQHATLPKSLGFFIGGILSPERNIFWSALDSPSEASPYIVDLYLEPCPGAWIPFDYSNSPYKIEIFPDKDYTKFTCSWRQSDEKVLIEIFDMNNRPLFSQYFLTTKENVTQTLDLPNEVMNHKKFKFHFKGSEEYYFTVLNND